MTKMISAAELAEIVKRLLTEPEKTIPLYSPCGDQSFQYFMTDIANVVCDHCGGEIRRPAILGEGDEVDSKEVWLVGIHGNNALPDESGGIWKDYDKDGELFEDSQESA